MSETYVVPASTAQRIAHALRDQLADEGNRTATQRARLEGALTVLEVLLGQQASLVEPALGALVAEFL